MSPTAYQDQYFSASPEEVFDALADSSHHTAMTGAAASIELEPGGRFSAYDGALEGKVLEAERPGKLELEWRGRDWQADETSRVFFDIEAVDDQTTVVHLAHQDLPERHYQDCSRGWGQYYWAKMPAWFLQRRRAVVERFVEEYKNRHNWDIVDEVIAEDCRLHLPVLQLPDGREGMRINGRAICTAFPDVHVTREFWIAQDDIVVERAHAKATHQAELMGAAATGRTVEWSELHAYRVQGDWITEIWTEADFMGILTQIGAVEMPS